MRIAVGGRPRVEERHGIAPFAQLSVAEMLDRLARADAGGTPRDPHAHAGLEPRGPRSAAMTCALAASLIEHIAHQDDSVLATARLARSAALRARVLELAERVEDGHRAGAAHATGNGLAIASAAAQLTSVAAECAAGGSDATVTDAIVAAELADGACRAAAHIVRIGLRDAPTDPRRTEASGLVASSAEALQDAFAEAAQRARAT